MTEQKKTVLFKEEIKCPHCKKFIDIIKEKTLIEPAVAAEWDEKLSISKAEQKKIEDFKEKKKKVVKKGSKKK